MTQGGQDVEILFAEARRLVGSRERAEFPDRSCAEDPALRQEVESLLDAAESAGDFMERPLSGDGSGSPGGTEEESGERDSRSPAYSC